MQKKIQKLSEQMINLINAGEVIENPSSCVKELIENSLDANATSIEIQIEAGGFQSIQISDDGEGMDRLNAPCCFERHATSKLSSPEELFSLSTLGFRGEALAAIAAVSKVRLLTKSDKESEGTEVLCEAGLIRKILAAVRNRGSTFTISSLFYNVPARQHFQKSIRSSAMDIRKWIIKMALCHPHVAFRYTNEGKLLLDLKKRESLKERALDLLGEEFLEEMIPIEFQDPSLTISGFIGKPERAKEQRQGQYLFVNGRVISSSFLLSAIQEAYGTRIGPKQHPQLLLHLSIDPSLVDPNVHPQKKEVRLREDVSWFLLMRKAILKTLDHSSSFPLLERPSFFSSSSDFSFSSPPQSLSEPRSDFHQPNLFQRKTLVRGLFFREGILLAILPTDEETPYLIDICTLQKRRFYHRLNEGSVERQLLLVPHVFSLESSLSDLVEKELPLLERFGISLHSIAPQRWIVEELSPLIEIDQLETFIRLLLKQPHQSLETQFSLILPHLQKHFPPIDLLIAEALVREEWDKGQFFTPFFGHSIAIPLQQGDFKKIFSYLS